MANLIKLKRSAVAGKAPVVGDLELGELALNTYDGKLYTKKDDGTASIVELSGGGGGGGGGELSGGTITGDYLNTSTGYFQLPNGTTAQRPGTLENGQMRYNTTTGQIEAVALDAWQPFAVSSADYGLITSVAQSTFDYGSVN